ncbi:hypothetical protein [Paenibacillus sp. FSL K6-2524]|uniref:hypothetical protein n=1 Tax=Paenibacillus sp. FSL K6-2524 TaxID=2954516 RepID=UPI0030FCDB0D
MIISKKDTKYKLVNIQDRDNTYTVGMLDEGYSINDQSGNMIENQIVIEYSKEYNHKDKMYFYVGNIHTGERALYHTESRFVSTSINHDNTCLAGVTETGKILVWK